jgi:flagellar hook-length control protein FliK
MPTMSPTLRETPVNLLAGGRAGLSSTRTAKPNGKADLFASVLNAQKPRTTLADSAREAQRSRISSELNQRSRVERNDSKPAREDRSNSSIDDDGSDRAAQAGSNDDEDAKRTAGADAAVRDGGADGVDARLVHEQAAATAPTPVAAIEDVLAPPHATIDAAPATQATTATTEVAPAPQVEGNEKPAQPRRGFNPEAATGERAAQQPQRSSEDVQARRNGQVDLSRSNQLPTVDHRAARPARGTEALEANRTSVEAEAKTHAGVGAKREAVPDGDGDAGREVVRRAVNDTFRQSASQADELPVDHAERRSGRPASSDSQPKSQPERASASAAAVTTSESDVQKATKQAIDALLNEQAPRGDASQADHQARPPSAPTSTPDRSASPAAPSAPTSSAAPASSAATFDASSATLSAATTLAGSAVASTAAGVPTLGGESALNGTSPSASGAEWMTRSDHAAGRILRGLSAMIHQNGGSMTMRLDPPELGSLRIQMSISNGSVSATFTPGNAAARGLLEQNMSQLKAALESQGLFVDRLSIQTASPSQTNAHTGQQHGTDGRGTNEQSSQYADAGQGESRGRSEQDSEQRRGAGEFFDPAALFESVGMSDGDPFAAHAFDRVERSNSA